MKAAKLFKGLPCFFVLMIVVLTALLTGCGIKTSEKDPVSVVENSTTTPKDGINDQKIAPTENADYKNSQLSKEELDLIGFWHDMPNVAAGYSKRYLFYKDRTYKYYPSSMENSGEQAVKGNWLIRGNKLQLLENGCIDGNTYEKPAEKVLYLGSIENASENPAYDKKIKIGDLYFWKINDDPDFLSSIDENSSFDSNYSGDLEKYNGEWYAEGYKEEKDKYGDLVPIGSKVVIDIDNEGIKKLKVVHASLPPSSRIAEFDAALDTDKNGVGTFQFDDDGFGNKGSGTIDFKGDKVIVNIKIEQLSHGMWNIFEGQKVFSKKK